MNKNNLKRCYLNGFLCEGGDILKPPIYETEYKFLFVNKQKLVFYYNMSLLNPNMNQHALNEREK